jgi:periplasmic protein CpxP/Spy
MVLAKHSTKDGKYKIMHLNLFSSLPSNIKHSLKEKDMKKMKLIVAAAFMFVSVSAFSQARPEKAKDGTKKEYYKKGDKRGSMPEANIQEYASQLNLTASQVTQWEALRESHKSQMQALKNNTELSKEDKKAQMKAMKGQKQAELQKIFTAEQYAQYQELRKAEREARQAQASERKSNRPSKGSRK